MGGRQGGGAAGKTGGFGPRRRDCDQARQISCGFKLGKLVALGPDGCVLALNISTCEGGDGLTGSIPKAYFVSREAWVAGGRRVPKPSAVREGGAGGMIEELKAGGSGGWLGGAPAAGDPGGGARGPDNRDDSRRRWRARHRDGGDGGWRRRYAHAPGCGFEPGRFAVWALPFYPCSGPISFWRGMMFVMFRPVFGPGPPPRMGPDDGAFTAAPDESSLGGVGPRGPAAIADRERVVIPCVGAVARVSCRRS